MTVSKSPGRLSFQKTCYINRCTEDNEQPDEKIMQMYEKDAERYDQRFDDPASRKYNLEYDLLTTDWILEKVRSSDTYAQNLYAALCNVNWQNKDLWKTLKEETWGCSWRYAGGIVADMQQKGDYIDWYCSGIATGDFDGAIDSIYISSRFVPEGTVTDEIAKDLNKIGWIPVPLKDDK